MILKTLNDSTLLSQLHSLVKKEREVLTEILWHLQEVEDRKLHLKEGFGSLFEYCTKVLLYSESQAFRRISAMRLLRELPQTQKAIESGKLNLTHLTQAQEYFKSEAKKSIGLNLNEKVKVLESLENKSTRETERIFAKLNPDEARKEKERIINEELVEIRFTLSQNLMAKLQEFKDLDSHVNQNPTHAEILDRLLDIALKQKKSGFTEKKKKPRIAKNSSANPVETVVQVTPALAIEPSAPEKSSFQPSAPKVKSRFIPKSVKIIIAKRDGHACSYVNPDAGKRCESRFKLQIDHLTPFAKGGENSAQNLRLLCQAHNLYFAEKEFGKVKMQAFRKL